MRYRHNTDRLHGTFPCEVKHPPLPEASGRYARSFGASKARQIFKHLLPNTLTPLVTFTPFASPQATA